MQTKDVIVIGGGAAGLMAATSAAERGLDVLLLEKNTKLGVKILMSGGTRCNITHNCEAREIIEAFGRNGRFLHSPLAALPPTEVIKKIEAQGVETKIESTGKIFPVSNKAIDVRDALVNMTRQAGAEIRNPAPVTGIQKDGDQFLVSTESEKYLAKSVIITTGGISYPGCGTTGDGYGWAKQFGHSIVDTVPALVPILCDIPWANALKGITIEETDVSVWQPEIKKSDQELAELTKSQRKKLKAKTLAKRKASFLFTHWGFSGPSVLDVSREVARHPDRKSLELVCDFCPSVAIGEVEDRLNRKKSSDGKQTVRNVFADLFQSHFPKRLSDALLESVEVKGAALDLGKKNAELSKVEVSKIAQSVKACRFSINGTLGFEKAEVTAGGVNLKEVDSKTMQSRIESGLYFAGEVLDLDGRIGGFNFQSAFSTGWLAGQSVL